MDRSVTLPSQDISISENAKSKRKTFTYEEVMEASVAYFDGDELAASVWVKKYALKNPEGAYLEKTPADMHRRLAKEFARIESKYPNAMTEEEIYTLLAKKPGRLGMGPVVPQGSPMSGVGNPFKIQSTSNCFVLDKPLDAYSSIMYVDAQLVETSKRRGGCGIDLSNIRPRGLATANSSETTDGIALFMERYSRSTREVGQGSRRGALMLTISVKHPEIETFIHIKRDKLKVTGANVSIMLTDEFMRAVEADGDFTLQWPVDVPVDQAKIKRTVRARDIWEQIIDSAWDSAEPGILFQDNILNNGPADIYPEYKSVSTNPCFSGETLIATADGRNAVPIRQLAEEGKDVPVYSVDSLTGKVSIKWGRNPRITGYAQRLLRVHLDDGSFVDVTPNHKFITLEGAEVEAKDLEPGTSLPRFTKSRDRVKNGEGKLYYRAYCDVRVPDIDKIFEHRLIAKFFYPELWEETYDRGKSTGFTKTGGLVVHHKDRNGLNNSPENLQVMTWKDHKELHAREDARPGEQNGRYSGYTHEEIRTHALSLTKSLGRRFSSKEWLAYAAEHELPQNFSKFRKDEFGSVTDLAVQVANSLGIENLEEDPRVVKTFQDMLGQGYEPKIIDGCVFVTKACEHCKKSFEIDHAHREQGFCSLTCALEKRNTNEDLKRAGSSKTVATYEKHSIELKRNQAKVFSALKFKFGREPLMQEWEQGCREEGLTNRVKTKFGYQNYEEVREAGNNYNHKVRRVEDLPGLHTVYNLTVDDNHTLAVITRSSDKESEGVSHTGVYVPQCGEIPLNSGDSCRLMVVDLTHFVKNYFSKEAYFDFDAFSGVVRKAQRLMDDLIDLELEALDKIIAKVESDPEPLAQKRVELDWWTKVRSTCERGRRTGLGITGLGDALAMLGVRYGSIESVEWTRKIYAALGLGAHRASIEMAEERGAFPAFDYELEKSHKYLNSIIGGDRGLKSKWLKFGRRNIALTTTAPVGSVSTLTQTTSGIEPVYALSYMRRKKINAGETTAKVDHTDALGDSWTHFTVYHHWFNEWARMSGTTDVEVSPYAGATSAEIDWENSVRLQAAAQESIDHSISRTCNMPKNVSHAVVSKCYLEAWKSGCKGFTIYREGSREGVLVSTANVTFDLHTRLQGIPKEELLENVRISEKHRQHIPAGYLTYIEEVKSWLLPVADSHKRPKELPCDIHRVTVKGETYVVLIGLLEGRPYEVFCGLSEHIEIPKKAKTGVIAKNGKKDGVATYNLRIPLADDELLIKDIVAVFENKVHGAFTRMLSLSLRHGIPLQFLVEQLQKDKHSDMQSFSRVISRVIKSYIEDGTKATGEKTCWSCGQDNSLVYQEGCVKCTACGASKCG